MIDPITHDIFKLHAQSLIISIETMCKKDRKTGDLDVRILGNQK